MLAASASHPHTQILTPTRAYSSFTHLPAPRRIPCCSPVARPRPPAFHRGVAAVTLLKYYPTSKSSRRDFMLAKARNVIPYSLCPASLLCTALPPVIRSAPNLNPPPAGDSAEGKWW
ncbi:hypothetical protein E2C01_054989 [Portunus trituberculatus]|uniref:Uncharacterized protein n=1 Tax=Portunus trituberculatus TaxID=210409 RepID=A0A5B7GTE6_PORTR|nr:hypothetical protein [Portunus trituberculatus]